MFDAKGDYDFNKREVCTFEAITGNHRWKGLQNVTVNQGASLQ